MSRRSTCVDLNLPISNPAFACDKCKPFVEVTVKTRKHARDVSCAQPWSIERWRNAKKAETFSDFAQGKKVNKTQGTAHERQKSQYIII